MINNDERREVAARLRELDVHKWYDSADEIDSLETAIGCSIGQDWQDQDWWNRLADLIEPEPEHTCKPDDSGRCKCGTLVRWRDNFEPYETCDGLIAYKSIHPPVTRYYEYCPSCGSKVVE